MGRSSATTVLIVDLMSVVNVSLYALNTAGSLDCFDKKNLREKSTSSNNNITEDAVYFDLVPMGSIYFDLVVLDDN